MVVGSPFTSLDPSTMVGDTIKSEFPPGSTIESSLPPQMKQEVQQILRDMWSEYTQNTFKADYNVNPVLSFEVERNTFNETIANLKSELAIATKQVQDACIVINGFKSQADSQAAAYASQVQQFEQRFVALSQREAALKADNAKLWAERDAAVELEKQLVLAKDQLSTRNLQLSSKLSDMQNEYQIKVAQLNDTRYARSQVEERLVQAVHENEYWRNHYGTSMSTLDGGPPPAVYFNVPQMPNRRNTVPDISPSLSRYVPFPQADVDSPRGQKRPRVDSVSTTAPPSPADVAPSHFSPTSPQQFQLRPVPSANTQAIAPVTVPSSQPGPSRIQSTSGVSGITSAPVAPPRPVASAPPAPAYTSPAIIKLEPVPQRAPQASLPAPQSSSVVAKAAISASRPLPTQIQQIMQQLFPVSAAGQRECKLCKNRPDGVPLLTSSDPVECLTHAEKYHTKVLSLLKSRLSQLV